MKYKTTIEIVTEAESKEEALEIAGEFLSGNVSSGVGMKYLSRPVHGNRVYVSVAVVAVFVCFLFVVMLGSRPAQNISSTFSTLNAVQPPLKTATLGKGSADFKRQWQDAQNREALNNLKNKN